MNAIQTSSITTPVFVNTWGNYNRHGANGGRWLTLPMEPKELETQLAELAAAMGDHDPEFCIHDIDAVTPAAAALLQEHSDYDHPQQVNEILLKLADLNEYKQLAVLAAMETGRYECISEAIENVDRIDFYEGVTFEEFAANDADDLLDMYNVPRELRYYFDYAAYQRNLEIDDYTEVSNGVVYIHH